NDATVTIPPSVSLYHFYFFAPMPIPIEVSDAPLPFNAGRWPQQRFDGGIGLTNQFAAEPDEPRHPELTRHAFLEMIPSHVSDTLTGYIDQNDPSFQSRTRRHGRLGVPLPSARRGSTSSVLYAPPVARVGFIARGCPDHDGQTMRGSSTPLLHPLRPQFLPF